jgi:hypothetical protein
MRRIVCAANMRFEGELLLGVRHWDHLMHQQHDRLPKGPNRWRQGFIDNQGQFLSRTEAWKVAEAAGQIIKRVGGDTADGGTLYSENLY